MKHTLERLSHKRQEKEKELSDKLNLLQEKSQALAALQDTLKEHPTLSLLEKSLRKAPHAPDARRRTSLFGRQERTDAASQSDINTELASALQQFQAAIQGQLELSQEAIAAQMDLARTQNELMEARDREWDALGNNHVSMIFKSMEWRIDKLRAGYDDAVLLMKTYVRLREQIKRLLSTLEGQKLPTPAEIRSVAGPLEDIPYAGFENRHRGSEQDVKTQQASYLPFFQTDRTVLDLGCGRGEFLDLLSQNGIPAEGIDLNRQMITTCRERGLECRSGDILETLSSYPEGSLGGIFSSQVVEHLRPEYLRRMIDLAFSKLAPSGHIVLETLNPTSVFALVHVYFLDITHQQPIHPQTLEFLLESAGFQEVEIRYSSTLDDEALQTLPPDSEASTLLNRNLDKLNQLLFSPVNYAAIGRKS
ncbi:MAG: methyltransferase domain-containing protein [Candidatus Aminicenantaceae bacterium]